MKILTLFQVVIAVVFFVVPSLTLMSIFQDGKYLIPAAISFILLAAVVNIFKQYKQNKSLGRIIKSNLLYLFLLIILSIWNFYNYYWMFEGGWQRYMQEAVVEHEQNLNDYKWSLIQSEDREKIAELPYFYDRHEVLIGIAAKNDDITVCDEFENFGQSVIHKARCKAHVLACDEGELSNVTYTDDVLSKYDMDNGLGDTAQEWRTVKYQINQYKKGDYSCVDVVPGSHRF